MLPGGLWVQLLDDNGGAEGVGGRMGRGVCGTSENPLGMGSPSAAVLGLREKLE